MEEKQELLTVKDATSVQKGILELVLGYPEYPESFIADNSTVKWSNLNEDRSIGLFPMQGAVYLKRYVSGSYEAQYPFQIAYKCSADTNRANIDDQTMLEQLAGWLEESGITFSDARMQLESIERTSPVFAAAKDDNTVTYAVNMQLRYFYKK